MHRSYEYKEDGEPKQRKRLRKDDSDLSVSVIPTAGALAPLSLQRLNLTTYDNPEDELSSFEERQLLPLQKESLSYEELRKESAQGLQKLGVCDEQIQEILILSRILHKEMRTKEDRRTKSAGKASGFDYTMISPDKMRKFQECGGSRANLEKKACQLKLQFGSPVRNPTYPSGAVYSPAARAAGLPRKLIQQGRAERIIRPLFINFNIAPIAPETPEERAERKKQQLIDFLKMEKMRGKISEDQIDDILAQKGTQEWKEACAEIKREIELWQDHLAYIDMRKKQLTIGDSEFFDEDEFQDEGSVEDEDSLLYLVPEAGDGADVATLDVQQNEKKVRKIRKGEIEDSFENFVASKLIYLEVEGYDLWFPKEIDLGREDEDGDTNLERMNRGLCPIGADGETMNFHHLTHYDFKTHKIKSIIVPLTEYVHRTYSGKLHFGRNTYQDLPRKKVNRNEWNKVRLQFNKSIAEYFISLSK